MKTAIRIIGAWSILLMLLTITEPGWAESRWFYRSDHVPSFVFRGRVTGMSPTANSTWYDGGTAFTLRDTNGNQVETPFGKVAVGAEGSAAFMISDFLAVEGSFGMLVSNNINSRLVYSSGGEIPLEGRVRYFPIMAALQYRPAPYGEIVPYFGVGYHYTLVYSTIDNVDFDNTSGLFLQTGFDWWIDGDIGFSLDVKKMFMDKITGDLSKSSIPISGRTLTNIIEQEDPWVFSAGVSYRF